jgi:hypothetical protein
METGSRKVAPRDPVSIRDTLDEEHSNSAATCSTVIPRSWRNDRKMAPSSLRRTVGLRASGTAGRFLSLPHRDQQGPR